MTAPGTPGRLRCRAQAPYRARVSRPVRCLRRDVRPASFTNTYIHRSLGESKAATLRPFPPDVRASARDTRTLRALARRGSHPGDGHLAWRCTISRSMRSGRSRRCARRMTSRPRNCARVGSRGPGCASELQAPCERRCARMRAARNSLRFVPPASQFATAMAAIDRTSLHRDRDVRDVDFSPAHTTSQYGSGSKPPLGYPGPESRGDTHGG